MLASVGLLIQERFHPFFKSIGGPAIVHFQEARAFQPFLPAFFLVPIALVELHTINRGWESPQEASGPTALLKDDYIPGDLGFDPLRLCPEVDSEDFIDARSKELNNGRLAMLGVAGIIAQELIDGNTVAGHLQKFGLGPAKQLMSVAADLSAN